jgi:hypothetical protein
MTSSSTGTKALSAQVKPLYGSKRKPKKSPKKR